MDIAIITRKMVAGGVEKALINMINQINNNINITLFVMELGGEFQKHIPNNVEIRNIYNFERSFKKKIIYEIKNKKVLSALKTMITRMKADKVSKKKLWYKYENFTSIMANKIDYKYDLVISYHAPASFPVIYGAEFIKADKKIAWIHEDVSDSREKMKDYLMYYNKYNKIYCISNTIKNIFDKEYPFLSDKTYVFYNIIDRYDIMKKSNEFKAFDDKFDGIRVLTVGRIDAVKGQLIIPRVVKKLVDSNLNIQWYCIGNGPLMKEMKNEIKKYKLEKNLILLGTKENPYPYFKECDIYVQTSKSEGFGITLTEAKILKKPIITTINAGAKEQINNKKNGLIVAYDENEIYDAINKILNDNELVNNIKFNLEFESRMINNTLNNLNEILT